MVRWIIERIMWMIRMKDCRHVCMWCEYWDLCREEELGKE